MFVGAFALSVLIGAELARPVRGASIAYDSQVAVLHWDRIVGGQLLEGFITTTPKPLLTVVFGVLHGLTGDWRALAWATILAFGVGVGCSALLARRVAGDAAGAFVAIGLAGSPALLFDVGLALATAWALVGWAAAGLLATASPPRHAAAGAALLLATLARLESLVVVGVIGLALLVAALRGRTVDRRAWLVPIIALGAIPVMCLHDWLLVRDPFMWLTVATRYSELTDLEVLTPGGVIAFLAARYASTGALTLLAVVGAVRLVRDSSSRAARIILVALTGLGPGVAVFLVLLATRGVFVSERYAAPIDIAVTFAAGVGLAGLSFDAGPWLRSRLAIPASVEGGRVASIVAAAAIAVVLTWPNGLLDARLRQQVESSLATGVDLERVVPLLADAIAAEPDAVRSAGIAVPGSVGPRLAIDLGLPTTRLVDIGTIGEASLTSGLLVLHHRRAERRPDRSSMFEIDGPTAHGAVELQLLASDAARGWWLVRIR